MVVSGTMHYMRGEFVHSRKCAITLWCQCKFILGPNSMLHLSNFQRATTGCKIPVFILVLCCLFAFLCVCCCCWFVCWFCLFFVFLFLFLSCVLLFFFVLSCLLFAFCFVLFAVFLPCFLVCSVFCFYLGFLCCLFCIVFCLLFCFNFLFLFVLHCFICFCHLFCFLSSCLMFSLTCSLLTFCDLIQCHSYIVLYKCSQSKCLHLQNISRIKRHVCECSLTAPISQSVNHKSQLSILNVFTSQGLQTGTRELEEMGMKFSQSLLTLRSNAIHYNSRLIHHTYALLDVDDRLLNHKSNKWVLNECILTTDIFRASILIKREQNKFFSKSKV